MRRPGIRNERGTQVGARRRMPSEVSRALRTSASLARASAAMILDRSLVAVFLAIGMSLHHPVAAERRSATRETRVARKVYEAFLKESRATLARKKCGC